MEQGLIPHGIAMDVNAGPLERAREHIREHGLEEKIETRLSDGLREIEAGEADTVVIAGMGGALTIRILEKGFRILPSLKELVLQPQSEIARVRNWLADRGYCIERKIWWKRKGNIIPCSGRFGEEKPDVCARRKPFTALCCFRTGIRCFAVSAKREGAKKRDPGPD